MGGIAAARGKYVIMGDADDSYDFAGIPCFVAKLREGSSLVQGCRCPRVADVMPGAMPLRIAGSAIHCFPSWPRLFWSPCHDIYCGMRGFTRELYQRLDHAAPAWSSPPR